MYSGAGSVGGNINLVSKAAREGEFNTLQAGAGTDDYGRVTARQQHRTSATAPRCASTRWRTRTMRRAATSRRSSAGASRRRSPSAWARDTRVTLSYLHQTDDNIPQYGVPYFSAYGGPLPGVDPSNYFGYHNIDTQEIDVDMLTGVLEHDFSDSTALRSLARCQQVDQYQRRRSAAGHVVPGRRHQSVADRACDLPRVAPAGHSTSPAARAATCATPRNGIAISQTDLTSRFDTGAVEHALVAGVSFSHEDFDLDTGNVFRAMPTARRSRCRR